MFIVICWIQTIGFEDRVTHSPSNEKMVNIILKKAKTKPKKNYTPKWERNRLKREKDSERVEDDDEEEESSLLCISLKEHICYVYKYILLRIFIMEIYIWRCGNRLFG